MYSKIDGALLSQIALQIKGASVFVLCVMGSAMNIVLKLAYHISDTRNEDISQL